MSELHEEPIVHNTISVVSEINEAPIVHNTISVGTFSTKHVELGSSSFNAIDTTIDVSSQNPVSNAVTKASLDVTKPPVVSAFSFKLVKTTHVKTMISQPNDVGHISFDYVAQEINTFGNGGTVNGTVIVPTSGTYLITTNVNATRQINILDITLKVNNTDVKNATGDGILLMSALLFINSGDIISLHSNNSTQSLTTLEVTLIKPDQTV